jgi:NAD(P)H-nitrite reductase large subunit
LIKEGITDINQIKAITRAGMGACGSKTCHLLIQRLLREEGVAASDIIPNTSRPLEFEVEFQVLANSAREEE